MENYVKTLHIEANTLVEIIQKDLLPSITTYMEKLAQTASLKKSVVPGISVSAEASLLSRLTELAETMTKDLETLKADTAMAEYEVDKDLLKSAKLYQSVVLTDMEKFVFLRMQLKHSFLILFFHIQPMANCYSPSLTENKRIH